MADSKQDESKMILDQILTIFGITEDDKNNNDYNAKVIQPISNVIKEYLKYNSISWNDIKKLLNESGETLLDNLKTNDSRLIDSIINLQAYIQNHFREESNNSMPIFDNLRFQLYNLQARAIIYKCRTITNNVNVTKYDPTIINLFNDIASALTNKLNTVNKIMDTNFNDAKDEKEIKHKGGSMNQNYKHKYLKYKHKYLEAKFKAEFI